MKDTKLTATTKQSDIRRSWHHVDLSGKVLGRMATVIAKKLIGKYKSYYVPYLDCGDYVVVTNAGAAVLTGKKEKTKEYHAYSGYPGGLKRKSVAQTREERPERMIEEAVYGMLPKNKLRDSMMKRLFVYTGTDHPYTKNITSAV